MRPDGRHDSREKGSLIRIGRKGNGVRLRGSPDGMLPLELLASEDARPAHLKDGSIPSQGTGGCGLLRMDAGAGRARSDVRLLRDEHWEVV